MTLTQALRALTLAQRELDSLREVNCRLRDALLAYAKECLACDGTGLTEETYDSGQSTRTVPCGECSDLRELLE